MTADLSPDPFDAARFADFLRLHHLPARAEADSPDAYWAALTWEQREDTGLGPETLAARYAEFLTFDRQPAEERALHSLDVLRGHDKSGSPERYDLRFVPGDVVCLVGPTGAGKSRLLADIECLAQRDTPTGRQVLINGVPPGDAERFSGESGLVAQISQNMNFVIDLPVGEFLHMHAESRALTDPSPVVDQVLRAAVAMAGEPFQADTQVTQLSGGQSRALMIADAAFLSPKPVVLIDEIENAGVDRRAALDLFVRKGKIVLLSTHDPLLALSGSRRLVIRHGAVQDVITPGPEELAMIAQLMEIDARLADLRSRLRNGERISAFPA